MKVNKTTSLYSNNYEDYKIKVSLNPSLCDKTFKDALRGKEEGHPETKQKYVNEKYRQRRPQTSFVFTGETNPIPESHIKKRYLPSNVMFNDSYIEMNPKIDKGRLIRYLYEKEIKKSNHLYSDDLFISPDRKQSVERRLRDNYGSNPMEIMSPQQQVEISQCYNQKNRLRQNAVRGYMNSDKIDRTFKQMKRCASSTDPLIKVTNQTYSMIKSSIADNSSVNEVKHGKKHFKVAKISKTDLFYL